MTVRNSYQESNILKMHFASLREIGLAKAQRRKEQKGLEFAKNIRQLTHINGTSHG